MSLDWLDPDETREVLDLLQEWFGIPPERFEDHCFGRRGDTVFAVTRVAREQAGYLNWVAGGLRLLTASKSGSLRPASRGLQVFGRWATRRVCDLDDPSLQALLRGASVPWEGERGPILLRWRGAVVGLGTARNDQLVSQLPRNVTEHLRQGPDGSLC